VRHHAHYLFICIRKRRFCSLAGSVFYASFFSSLNPYSFLRIIRDVKSFASGVLTFTVGPNAKINERPVRGLGGWEGRGE
jgi:hypothetical protein